MRRRLSPWLFRRARQRLEREDRCAPLGQPLVVPPGVFHPALTPSTRLLYRAVLAHLPLGSRVVDVGCGSGAGTVALAAAGHRVGALDRNPAAVAATRANLARNGLKAHVWEGDLSSLATHPPQDALVFNPPFYLGRPGSPAEGAWRETAHGPLRWLVAQRQRLLAPQGGLYLVLSDDGGMEGPVRDELGSGRMEALARGRFWDERLVVVRLS